MEKTKYFNFLSMKLVGVGEKTDNEPNYKRKPAEKNLPVADETSATTKPGCHRNTHIKWKVLWVAFNAIQDFRLNFESLAKYQLKCKYYSK